MYKVGVCGHFGSKKNLLNGQTVKTKLLTEELRLALGTQDVNIVDTHNWKKNPLKLFLDCYLLIRNCENVIILPAQNGISIFVPLFLFLNKIYKRKLHYVVIGGWLPNLLGEKQKLKNQVSKLDGIYAETNSMIKSLQQLGLNNVQKLVNFKRLDILQKNERCFSNGTPFKLCTFSRVMKEKGIEDAVNVVKNINTSRGQVMFTLDIYGQVEEDYKERFEELQQDFPDYISYKGSVDFDKSVGILKGYFALLFPTHFKTEGIPGTIIDAYAAGVPVIASKWNSADEVITEGITGYIYNFMELSELELILNSVLDVPEKMEDMKGNCLKRAEEFLPEKVISEFIKNM
ncbi:glycosyltransferase [Bacillus mycoides]|uniref:glycosyltransferase n=1 Tax=Bacillus mycoides TaxID=1405 RepID=UPI001C01CFA9|nr:glycosyltransferase [Bacillus mycoides]QWH53347.1 glycosyltransferase family 1 protein [Bacillus mycoides]QWJ00339.1 glycosyltransferase [Bacillus mycoides]